MKAGDRVVVKVCDNASVGVLITNHTKQWLMIERATFPFGVASVAGHVFDDHPGWVRFLAELGLARMSRDDLDAVDQFAARPVGS
ncbi:hypothetical protein [Nonomuraea turcica]|uniref:hypothetical protein n=1 Tax=Nonomuraea sp. G32 TaxID=3067274 RepID=UPI00273B7168|nr:hypothetical protein [Nonomuraea sp. G32]MDP4501100.1 hypothetical protein [Nonomuraea sp. G32]